MSDPKFVAFLSRLQRSPLWFAPRGWTWQNAEGSVQSIEPLANNMPGMANLLWLSLPLERPSNYDARYNDVYMWLLAAGGMKHNIPNWPDCTWEQLAEGLTLEQFCDLPPPPNPGPGRGLQDLATVKAAHAKAKAHT